MRSDAALVEPFKSKYTVKAATDSVHTLTLPKRVLDHFLGRDMGLATQDQVGGPAR